MVTVDVFLAIAFIGVLLVVSVWLRRRLAVARRLFLPASLIGGVIALLLGPQVLGRAVAAVGWPAAAAGGLIPERVLAVWSEFPGLMISVVFAALFIGKPIPGIRSIWRTAGPQVALGQSMAWGQYVVGLGLGILVLTPFFGLPPAAGTLLEIGFEGGHGTAAGLAATFEEFGFAEGTDLALALATIGLVAGVVVGTALVNWAIRRGRIDSAAADPVEAARNATDDCLDDLDDREGAADHGGAVEPLSVHLGLVAVAVGIGWLLLRGLVLLEAATWGGGDGFALMVHLPLFPMAMIGGVILQIYLDRTGRTSVVDRHLVNRISGLALDIIIVAALGTLSLAALGGNLAPVLILAGAGIVWNVGVFLTLAPRIIPAYPYERGLGDLGQSMGMTVTGLLLMRIADPTNRSGGLEAFGYKQMLFEPVVGGGLFTAASVPLVVQLGPLPVLIGCAALLVFWVVLGLRGFGGPAATG